MPKRKPSAHFAKQAQEAYELSLSGLSYRQIAEEMGVSLATVQRRLELYIKERVHPKADEYRARQIDSLHMYLRALRKPIESGDPKAIANAVRIQERIAKLLGLDSATAFKVEMQEVDPFRDRHGTLTILGQLLDRNGGDGSEYHKQAAALEQARAEGKPLPSRPTRPTPQRYLDKEREREEARERAKNRLVDEFASEPDANAALDVPEGFEELGTSEPQPAPKRSRRGKPIPNPAHRFLRDSDD